MGSGCKTKGTSSDTTSTECFNYFSENGDDSAEITEFFQPKSAIHCSHYSTAPGLII